MSIWLRSRTRKSALILSGYERAGHRNDILGEEGGLSTIIASTAGMWIRADGTTNFAHGFSVVLCFPGTGI
jgi:fructose-1,6-bisphosphatase/inositol monophosphatase family enzyme